MNKRLIILGFVILCASIVLKLVYIGIRKIKIDDFKPAAIIFVVDSSASNQKNLPDEKKYIKQLCTILDPDDQIKIINVSEYAYLIYEGSPGNISEISKSMEAFTKYNPVDRGTAYGTGLRKAFEYSLMMKKDNYVPAIIVIGDLANEGKLSRQLNWDTFPQNVAKAQEYMPNLSMMFLFAHPAKLDYVKTKLDPVLGENHLIVAPQESVNKTTSKFLHAIGR